VLYFSTGAHPDYHTPYDSPDRINYTGLDEISTSLAGLITDLAGTGEKLAFTEAGPKQGVSRGTRMKGVTLGIMPDFAGNVKNGLRADVVTPGKPAAVGGMQNGDIIKSINGLKINNIEDYMFRLSNLENGETISVEVEREGETVVLLITL
jgi:C-terminal processing protease CtpA/Prc